MIDFPVRRVFIEKRPVPGTHIATLTESMNIRVLYNYLLVRLGLRKILPAEVVNRKEVRECGESLTTAPCDLIIFANKEANFARKGVIGRLVAAAKSVHQKHGLKLLVYELYRSPENQAGLRDRDRKELVAAHPEYSESQLEAALNRISAKVGGSGHQTGGAVDLTLCDESGHPLDMGTLYLEHDSRTVTDCPDISESQRRNRQILLDAMRQAGFVNYPAEWWHFCYGDRMWAAYARKPYAIYGEVTQEMMELAGS